jgi:hypothetical protein
MIATVTAQPIWVAKRKTGDQSVTSSTVLVDETDMQFAIGVNETWVVEWVLTTTFSAAGQIDVAVVTPAAAAQLVTATQTPNAIVPAYGSTTVSGTAIGLVCAAATAGMVRLVATVVNGANAGTVKMQFAQHTSDGTATTVKANSYMVARKAA